MSSERSRQIAKVEGRNTCMVQHLLVEAITGRVGKGQLHPAAYQHVGGLKVQETAAWNKKVKSARAKEQQQMKYHKNASFCRTEHGVSF
jgi:hypothetical protein